VAGVWTTNRRCENAFGWLPARVVDAGALVARLQRDADGIGCDSTPGK
jgi:hypothetical protein